MTGAKRAMSILLSAVMLMGNLVSPITAFAGEAATEGNEVYEVPVKEDKPEQPATEAPDYMVTVPYYTEAAFMVDEDHVKKRANQGDTVLSYKAGDDVKITVSEREGFELEGIRILDEKSHEQGYSWEREDTFAFRMPEMNVKVNASFREPPQEKETKTAAPADEDIVLGDVTAAGKNEEAEETESATEETGSAVENGEPAVSGIVSDGISPEEPAATETVPAEETAGVPEPDTGAEVPEPADTAENEDTSESKDLQIPAIDPETEADGFPVGGSIVRLGEVTISDQVNGYEADVNLDVPYQPGTCHYEMKSSTVQYGEPGLYEIIYRADESSTGRFWYVVLPVRVVEEVIDMEAATEGQDDPGSDEDASAKEDDPSHPGVEEETKVLEATTEEGGESEFPEPEIVDEEVITEPSEETEVTTEDVPESETAQEASEEDDRLYNLYFATGEGYTITLDHDQVTYQEGEEVSFTVTAKEKYAIRTASAFVALSGEEAAEGGDATEEDVAPILITQEKVEVSRTDSVMEDGETVEASFDFEMPADDVVLEANVAFAASASSDITVSLENGSIKSIPKSWTPDGQTWSNGSTTIGYTVYRTVTMPDGKERKAYCMQPFLDGESDGRYSATEIRKKGKLSEAEATLLRKGVFYGYGGPGWATGEIKSILSDCSTKDEYYVATHYILAKIYCDATSGNWNVAKSGDIEFTAVNARGKKQIEDAVSKLKTLGDPDASLSPTQVAGAYNEATGFAQTQPVTYSSTVTGNTLTITLPAGVYLDITGGESFSPGQEAQIPPGSTFVLKKKDYEAAHQEVLTCKAAIFTDFDAFMINVGATKQNLGFSYVADKDFELSVTWPDLLTHFNIVKVDAHTGTSTPTSGYNMDGAVYGIYADAGKNQLLEQLTISGGKAVSSENYLIGGTYYIAEISAPAEYKVDPKAYPVMAVAGGTATVTSSDVPKTIKISVQKTDKETGETKPQTSGITFEGAVFGIFSDAACTVKAVDMNGNAISDIRTDANGHAETPQSLLIGDYYVKELAAPAGYLVNTDVYTVTTDQVRDEIVNQDADAAITCEEQIIRANMELMKVKNMKDRTTQAAEGVEFTFTYVNDPSVTFSVINGKDNTVVTDAEGFATTASDRYPKGTLIYGEWEITESNTPEGFEPLDPTRFMITGDGRTYRYVANNRQICAAVLIEKHDANTGSLIPVAGVKFQLLKDGEPVKLFNPTTRAYEDTWITDADGMVQLPEMVDYGTYVVKEDPESIPDGYFVMDDRSFTVDEMAEDYLKPITLTANEPPQLGNIMVEKRDAKTDEMLEGFSFEILIAEDITDPVGVIRTGTDSDGNEVQLTAGTVVDRLVTGKNGNAVSKDLFLGNYTVRETKAKSGYAITKETQDVTIRGDAAKARNKENVSEYVLFKNEPTTVKILKVSSKADVPLKGITFLVHKLVEGEAISDYAWTGEEESSDGEINAVIDNGSKGDGKAEESTEDETDVSASENSGLEDSTVSGSEDEGKDGQDPEDAYDESGYPEADQTSGLDEGSLSADELHVTDENGEILVEYLDADSIYVIREIKTIPGYNLSHELVSFAVDSEGLIDGSYIKEVTMKNDPNRVRISKQDITNSEEIPGAQLTITDSEGMVVAQWTSTYEIHEIDALPAGTYVLTEVTAPDSYEVAESITFKVINSRKIQAVVMKDSPYREVEISKTDITGDKELAGAHLTITDREGNEIESWESTAQVHTVKLHSGEYVLTETKPADGYATAESIPFTVIRTSATDYDVMGVTMKDDVTKVKISKMDITDAKPVIGAELVIQDADGNEVAKWTTSEEPYYIEMLPIGTYTLTEITAPSGYATAETVEFTVADTGEIQMVEMKDAPITAEISKKDIADGPGGNELPGAHLTVKNEKGEVIDDWVSTKEPHKMTMLPVGKYTLTEVTAPKGYEVAETITFEITDTGEVHKVTMYDSPKEETVDLTGKKKTTTTGGGYTPSGTPGVTSVVTPPVKTGDESPIMLFVLLGLMAVFTGGLAISLKRKGRIV